MLDADLLAGMRVATAEELMETIWVAAEMRAGGAYAHTALALDTITEVKEKQPG
jgi:hypothetical protein